MKRLFAVFLFILLFAPATFAHDGFESAFEHDMPIQKRVNNVGFRILNSNKLDKRIVFQYEQKGSILKNDISVINRQVLISDDQLKFVESDDELASYLAREISLSLKSYDGGFGGFIGAMQVKLSPKKFEIAADKRAVDFLVKAGYNPLALITFINKTCPQARQDKISKKNLTSKRLMYIYERIYFEYPHFLAENTYISNPYYQNFLLGSIENRKLLQEKIKNNDKGEVKYE